MANLKISQLTDGSPVQATDQFPINRAGANFRISGLAPTASPTFTGTVTLPAAITSANTVTIAPTSGNTVTWATGSGKGFLLQGDAGAGFLSLATDGSASLRAGSGTNLILLGGSGAGVVLGSVVQLNGTTVVGNGVTGLISADSSITLTANYNAGSAKSVGPAGSTSKNLLRVSGFQAINRAATSNSTFPSLTLGYTDGGSIARTLQLVATSAANATTVITSFSTTIYADLNAANVTLTSASYASSGVTTMQYTLAYAVEQLI